MPSSRSIGSLLGVVVTTGLAGCALFTSLDGFSSPAGADAASTATAQDGGSSGDGDAANAGDAAAKHDAPAASFCAGNANATACTGFDTDDVAAGFELVKTPGTTVSLVTSDFTSAPRSMVATVAPTTGAQHEAYGALGTSISKPVSRVHTRFAFRLVAASPPPTSNLEIYGATFRSGSLEHQVNFVVDAAKHLFVDEWSSSPNRYEHHDLGAITDGWHTVELDIVIDGIGAGSATATVDGKTSVYPTQPNMATAQETWISFGISWIRGAHGGWTVGFDDYVLDSE